MAVDPEIPVEVTNLRAVNSIFCKFSEEPIKCKKIKNTEFIVVPRTAGCMHNQKWQLVRRFVEHQTHDPSVVGSVFSKTLGQHTVPLDLRHWWIGGGGKALWGQNISRLSFFPETLATYSFNTPSFYLVPGKSRDYCCSCTDVETNLLICYIRVTALANPSGGALDAPCQGTQILWFHRIIFRKFDQKTGSLRFNVPILCWILDPLLNNYWISCMGVKDVNCH